MFQITKRAFSDKFRVSLSPRRRIEQEVMHVRAKPIYYQPTYI